jgi:hypothetical protein
MTPPFVGREHSTRDEQKDRTPAASVRRRTTPLPGDVLVSRRRARADMYAISVIAGADRSVVKRHDDAIRRAAAVARTHGVDGWYTADQIHFVRIAHYRSVIVQLEPPD